MTYLIFTNNLTVFTSFRRHIFTDLISGTFSMDLFLTLFGMGFFGAAHGSGGGGGGGRSKKAPLPKISVTHILQ